MDPFHERLAQVGLAALARYGFALAGGYAVQAHGLLERPSEDVDMFTTLTSEQTFPEAVRAAVTAYADAGLSVDVLVENATFASLVAGAGTCDLWVMRQDGLVSPVAARPDRLGTAPFHVPTRQCRSHRTPAVPGRLAHKHARIQHTPVAPRSRRPA